MRGFNVAVHLKNAADARCIFDAFADGGKIDTPLSDVAWSSAFGVVTDKFGTPWQILSLDQ